MKKLSSIKTLFKKGIWIILMLSLSIGCVASTQNTRKKYNSSLKQMSNGIIYDKTHNLMWASKDNGESISWFNAKKYCEDYRAGGYTDWRLPTLDELALLYDESTSYKISKKDYNVHLTELIQLSDCCLFASNLFGTSSAYTFNYTNANVYFGYKSKAGFNKWIRVLPVRRAR